MGRRAVMAWLATLGAPFACGNEGAPAGPMTADLSRDFGNFRTVYGDPQWRAAFRDFVTFVFHLYPEQELDELIARFAHASATDAEVYAAVATHLSEIAPFLGSVRYALPALNRQKAEMASQTVRLLEDVQAVQGYLEIGSHGRYLHRLRERVEVNGPIYTMAPQPASSTIVDVLDRGRFSLPGKVLEWNDYGGFSQTAIEPESLDLVTIYIGLHHAKESDRAPFLESLRQVLSPNGRVVIRDHDVTSEQMRALVGLAHDVFNVGTQESWATNAAERRNFYSVEYLVALFEAHGFRARAGRLLQQNDPTHNTLLAFAKA